MAQHYLFVMSSLAMFLAFLACGVGFFAPYWLGNVTNPVPGSGGGEVYEDSAKKYISIGNNSFYRDQSQYKWRGLWAQCAGVCQWFWANDYQLQNEKFTALRECISVVGVVVHCAASATYQIFLGYRSRTLTRSLTLNPNPNPITDPNPNPKINKKTTPE